MFIEQIAVYAVLGLALDAAGQDYTKPIYWCVLVLVAVSNYIARREGYDEGIDDAQTVLATALDILEEANKKVDSNDK